MHVSNHRFQWTPRNCLNKLVASIWTQTVTKSSEKWRLFTGKSWLKIYSLWVLGHIWTGFSMLVNFVKSTLSTYYTFLRQKSLFDFSLLFTLFHRQADFRKLQQPPESAHWGFHGGIPSSGVPGSPPNHYCQKKNSSPEILNYTPSPLCIGS